MRLKDVAEVTDGAENDRLGAWAAIQADEAHTGNEALPLSPAIIVDSVKLAAHYAGESHNEISSGLADKL